MNNQSPATARPLIRLLLLAVLTPAALAQTRSAATHRPIIRYTVNQRVEYLDTDQWRPATVLAWDHGKLRIRTDDNAELIVPPLQLRKYTHAPSYPIKAAPEDIAAINPPPAQDPDAKPTDDLRPGLPQPAEADPAKDKPKPPADLPAEPPKEKPGIPLPPAPNALPNDLPNGDLTTATPLASPEKFETRALFQPDPSPAPAHALVTTPIPLRPLDTRDNVFDNPVPLLFTSPEFSQAFVPHRDRGADAPTDLYYDRYDTSTGQRTGGFAVPPGARPLDLSPDGTRLLLSWSSTDAGAVQDDCLGLFVILNDRLSFRAAFRPYASIRNLTTNGVATAHFIDPTHVLTSTGSDLTCWDLTDTPHALYRLYPIAPCRPALSPTRKYVAIVAGTTPWLLDSRTGQPALKLNAPLPPGASGPLSLSPTMTHLACLSDSRLLTWPLPTGNAPLATGNSDIALSLPNAPTTLDWLSPGFALINHQYCADLTHQLLLWDYPPEDNGVGGSFANQYWYSTPSPTGRVLAHAPLPHAGARQAAAAINPATVMAIHPGAKVSIDLTNLDASDLLKSRAVTAITVKLQANGLEVADHQPLRLVVTSIPGETREITYRGATEASTTTVNLPEDLVTIAFVEDHKTAWQTTRPATPPGTLSLRPGQSAEDLLTAERARLRLVAATNVTFPKFVPHPRATPFYGRTPLSDLTPTRTTGVPPVSETTGK